MLSVDDGIDRFGTTSHRRDRISLGLVAVGGCRREGVVVDFIKRAGVVLAFIFVGASCGGSANETEISATKATSETEVSTTAPVAPTAEVEPGATVEPTTAAPTTAAPTTAAPTTAAPTTLAATATAEVELEVAAAPTAAEPTVASDDAGASADDEATEADVLDAFERYREALLVFDGETAATVASASTLDWYDELLDVAISADDSAFLNEVSIIDGLSVIAMRARFGADLLEVADGRELFIRGVEEGMVGESVKTMQFERIDITGEDEAAGVLGGLPVARFVVEAGTWRFDMYELISTIAAADDQALLATLSGGAATTRLELFELLSQAYGQSWTELAEPLG